VELNPLTALVDLYRRALLGGPPSVTPGLAALAIASASILALGVLTFRRLAPAFADEL
jgi:ABC-type polysaccharide/polyol phosphate export permease